MPTTDISSTTIYLLTSAQTVTSNLYTEYIYVNNTWEKLGTQELDLTNYYTKTQVDGFVSNLNTSIQANATDIDNLEAKDEELTTLINQPVSNEGTDITLIPTIEDMLKEVIIKGNTEQNNENISPNSTRDIKVVTGNNTVVVQNKNKFDMNTIQEGKVISSTGVLSDSALWNSSQLIKLNSSTIAVSMIDDAVNNIIISEYDKNKDFIDRQIKSQSTPKTEEIIHLSNSTTYIILSYRNDQNIKNIQIEEKEVVTDYVLHKQQNLPLNLGDIELCKIGNHQDYIYKNNNKWYYTNLFTKIDSYNGEIIESEYISTTGGLDVGAKIYYYNSLNNPVEITDVTLITQLETILKATTYSEETNITTKCEEENVQAIIYAESSSLENGLIRNTKELEELNNDTLKFILLKTWNDGE